MKDSRRTLRDESSPKGREIWRAVDKAAAKAPEWLRKRVEAVPLKTERVGAFRSEASGKPESSS